MSGDIDKARKSFQESIKAIANDQKAMEAASIAATDFREAALKTTDREERKKRVEAAAEQYKVIIERGETTQGQLLMGRLYLDTAMDAESRKTALAKIQSIRNVEDELLDVFHYNLGRALEVNGRSSDALKEYEKAIRADPYFRVPAERGYQMLREAETADVDGAVALSQTLLDQGQGRFAVAECIELLKKPLFASDEQSGDLAGIIAQEFARDRLTPPTWVRDYEETLSSITVGNAHSNVKAVFDDMSKALHGDVALHHSFDRSPSTARAISMICRNTGDYYRAHLSENSAEADHARVLRCYVSAWSVDRRNFDAAILAVDVYQNHDWDEQSRDAVIGRFLDQLFDAKGGLYRGLSADATPEKWGEILRFHTLLGTLFERDEDWGNPRDPYSAVFQWRYAINAAARSEQPHLIPSLQRRLGVVASRAGNTNESRKQLEASFEGHIDAKDHKAAAETWLTAHALEVAPAGSPFRNHPFKQSLGPVLLKDANRDRPLPATVGRISFGPEGVICVQDIRTQSVICFDLADADLPNRPLPDFVPQIENLNERVAGLLGIEEPREVLVYAMAKHPQSGLWFLTVNVRNRGPSIVTVGPQVELRELKLDRLRRVELCGLPPQSYYYSALTWLPAHLCLPVVSRARDERPQASLELYSVPDSDPALPVVVEIYDPEKRGWSSATSIIRVASLRMNGELYLAGCTRQMQLFVIPVAELRPGRTVRGRPIATRNLRGTGYPDDLVALDGDSSGPPLLILATREGGVLRMKLEQPDGFLKRTSRLRAGVGEALDSDGRYRLATAGNRQVLALKSVARSRTQSLVVVPLP